MTIQEKELIFYASQDEKEVLVNLDSSEQGLSQKEVEKRLRAFGYNRLVQEKKPNLVFQYLSNFTNPLVLILLFAALVSFVLNQRVDAIIISTIVLLSTTLNFFQEYHANEAAKKLNEKIAHETTVIRDGKEQEIKSTTVCVGDIFVLNAGDLIPADARLLSAKDFFVNQSVLTGESFPVEKTYTKLQEKNTSLTDFINLVFSGSSVITGTATAVVVKTGINTEFGKIGTRLETSEVQSEFTNGVKNLSLFIMKITIFFVSFIFLFNIVFKHTSLFDSFTFAVALAVGLTPELLPMIMSINMAKGSVKMAKKGAIVKRLTAIPNFGSMDMLCTDKTGTLTDAHIRLVKYTDVKGTHSEQVFLHAFLNSFFQTGIKNPMDDAVIEFKREDVKDYKKIDEIPFDFMRKRTSIVVENDKKRTMITKGAPEEIFKVCTDFEFDGKQKEFSAKAKEDITELFHSLSQEGYRVLAVATKSVSSQLTVYDKQEEHHLSLIGFIAFLDPAKSDVKEVLTRINAMGIEVKVITGDNELVTKKICEDVGISVKGLLLSNQLRSLNDDALKVIVEKTTIFARFSPDDKNRVIQALKNNGHVVGYMGDGINDAPSLKTADVGISVNNAVDVAKESADIILTHKSLKELEDGIIEGRKTFGNTMKYIMMGISSNFGNMFSVLGAVVFIPFLPMLSIQILLNNLLYDLSQITIPSDHVDKEFTLKPQRWNMKFIKEFMAVFGTLSSLFDFFTFFTLYAIFHLPAGMFQTGWFMESLATQTLVIYIIRTRHIPFLQSVPSKYLVATTLLAVSVGWSIPFSPLAHYFNFSPIPVYVIITIISIVCTYLLSIELAKRFFYKKYSF